MPCVHEEFVMSVLDPKQLAFRNAMAHMTAAVNVITSNGPAEIGRAHV